MTIRNIACFPDFVNTISVLDILESSKIYRTDLEGTIEIKLNKKGYKINTYEI